VKRLDGPAKPEKKILYEALKNQGVEEHEMPEALRNSPVAKSRKGPAGAIVVRRMTGVVDNGASRLMRRFEQNVGGKEEIVEKLEAIPERLNEREKALLNLLRTPTKKGLARLVAEAGAEPTQIMKKFAEGCIELGKVEAAIEAHRNLPSLVKSLYKHALSEYGVCGACGGTGALHRKSTDHVETIPCTFCETTGVEAPSKLKEFATRQLLEVTKSVEKGGGVTVNTAVGVRVDAAGGGASVFEKMMKASDEVLYRRERVVEAEVVGEG